MHSALVTGAHGFIGRHLVDVLRRHGVEVGTLGCRPTGETSHIVVKDGSWEPAALERILVDIQPDCIFHLAGSAQGSLSELTHVNLGLTQSLLRALARTSLRPVLVIAGSAAEYGSAIVDGEPVCETASCAPVSPYGVSKHAQTRAALTYAAATSKPVLVARIFNPLGSGMPGHLAMADFARQIAAMPAGRGRLRVGNIDVRRDMIDVAHVASLLPRLAENPDARGVVNVCSGEAPVLRDLIGMLLTASGRTADIEVDPARQRANELRTIMGSTDRLTRLGCPPPPTDFPAVIAGVWENTTVATADTS
jgi:GDP-4-dehydro-6-deoxy-D-mannose reductase